MMQHVHICINDWRLAQRWPYNLIAAQSLFFLERINHYPQGQNKPLFSSGWSVIKEET